LHGFKLFLEEFAAKHPDTSLVLFVFLVCGSVWIGSRTIMVWLCNTIVRVLQRREIERRADPRFRKRPRFDAF
jgi:hypothetical protein